MLLKLTWKDNICFEGMTESGHSVIMDTSAAPFGQNRGPTPMELVALSLGGCTGMDVVSILIKRKVIIDDFQIVVRCERKKEHPKVFSQIEIEYLIRGKGIRDEDVALAVGLSKDKYCSVGNMLNKTAEIGYKWKIIDK